MARKEKVTKVIDGDTFETASRKNPVRLANVDTPEKGQPGASKAKEALRKLIQGKYGCGYFSSTRKLMGLNM